MTNTETENSLEQESRVSHIVCMSKDGIIGVGLNIPWYIPEDLKYFREKTKNNVIIMGRATYNSIGKPLPNRLNIAISSFYEEEEQEDNLIKTNSIEKAMEIAKREAKGKEIFIVGGGTIYDQTKDLIDCAYINIVNINIHTPIFNKINSKDIVYYPELSNDMVMIESKPLNSTHTTRKLKSTVWVRQKEETDVSNKTNEEINE